MKYIKKKKISNTSIIDRLRKSNPKAEEMFDLVDRFPLKDSMEIITRNSGWGIIENPQTTDKGIASFSI